MQALEGLLVVAAEQAVAAPFCTARLAQAGARVIKIERSDGDLARGYDTAALGESSYFTWLNQGKESVVVDIKSDRGRVLLSRLLEKADVFVQNFAPGALDRAGFDHQTLASANPHLIRCNISGYGDAPSVADKRGYDLLVQAESGLIATSGAPDTPGRIGVSICDIGAGMTAYQGILEAVLKRATTGRGSAFSVSLFDVAADWMAVPFIHAVHGDGAPRPAGLSHPSIAPYGAFETRDGQTLLIAVQNEREWQRFVSAVLEAPHLAEDPRFSGNVGRVRNRDAMNAELNARIGALDAATLIRRLEAARIAYGRLNTATDLPAHDALRTQLYRTSADTPVSLPAHPVHWTEDEPARIMRAPALGEHTDQVTREFAPDLLDAVP